MSRAQRTHPRLVGDVLRTLVALGLSMVVSPPIGYLYARLGGGDLSSPAVLGVVLYYFSAYFVLYQVLTWVAFHRADPDQLVAWVRASTPRSRRARWLLFWTGSGVRSWAATAALIALISVVVVLAVPTLRNDSAIMLGALLAVASSWSMVALSFAVAYLRLDAVEGGFDFPGGDRPVWSDYVYLAVQVSSTFATSDVDATSSAASRLVTGHTVLAFVFNTVIVALVVSALVGVAG